MSHSVSRRAILALAGAATGLLLLDGLLSDREPTGPGWLPALLVAMALGIGATAIVAAWTLPPAQESADGSEPGPTKSASHSSSGRMALQSRRTVDSAFRVPSDGPAG
jgi:hypothetical protein